MIDTISEYIDLKLLGIFLVALTSFVVLKIIFRRVSLPKIVAIFLTLFVIVGNTYLFYWYISDEERILINSTNQYYIKGNVRFVSNAIDKLRVEYTDTNVIIQDLEDKEILVKVASSTGIYNREGKKITLNDISSGDMIMIKTTRGVLKGGQNELTAKSIQKY